MISKYLSATRQILPAVEPYRTAKVVDQCASMIRQIGIDAEVVVIRTKNMFIEYVTICDKDYIIFDTELADLFSYFSAIYYQISPNRISCQQLMHSFLVNQLGCLYVDNDEKILRRKMTSFSRKTKNYKSIFDLLRPVVGNIDFSTFLKIFVVPMAYAFCHEAAHVALARNSASTEYWRGRAILVVEHFSRIFPGNPLDNQKKNINSSDEIQRPDFQLSRIEGSQSPAIHPAMIRSQHFLEEITCDVMASDICLRFALASGLSLDDAVECIFASHRNLFELHVMRHDLDYLIPSKESSPVSNDETDWRAIRLVICMADLATRAASLVAEVNGERELLLNRKQDGERFVSRATKFYSHLSACSQRYQKYVSDDRLKYKLGKKFPFK